jgi:hypothetical protein
LEIEYHESTPVENLKSYFAIPLRPDVYSSQAAAISGAKAMAEEGADFQQILSHYYPNTKLISWPGVQDTTWRP